MSSRDRLSPLDASFLYLESPTAHMHVGSLSFFEDVGASEEAMARHVESRLHLVPRYRQKLAWVPGQQGRPVWVDDPHFDIRNHLIFTGVPKPAGESEIMRLASRLLSRPLDRRRPLWEMWAIRMKDGRNAIVTKNHHCLVDGISAVDIGTAIMDFSEEEVASTPPPWTPAKEPSKRALLTSALWERATQPREMARSLRAATRTPRTLLNKSAELAKGLVSYSKAGLDMAPKTSFTKLIGPHRRYDIVRTDLGDIKAVKNHFGCTVNDVVLALVSGGIRRLLSARGERADGLVLRAMVPVSVRADSERYTYGNKVSWVVADLPVGLDDPSARVRFVHESMKHLKESKQAVGAEFWFKVSEYAPPTVLALAARAASFQRMCNLVVTNIPGPQFPLFLQGGRLLEAFPVVPIMGVTSLGVAVFSYNGRVNFGLNADWDLFPDVDKLARGIAESLDELLRVAGVAAPAPVRRAVMPAHRAAE